MSVIMGDAELAGTADDVIIREEVDALDDLAAEQDGRKRDIILRAADKLGEKYADNPSIVGQRLKNIIARDRLIKLPDGTERQVFARVSPAYVYMIIPARYKVEYEAVDPEEESAKREGLTPLERFLDDAGALCLQLGPMLDAHAAQLEDMRTSKNKEDQEAFAAAAAEFDSLNKLGAAKFAAHTHEIVRLDLSGPAELTGAMTQSLARAEADAAALRKLSDRRIKFSTATRIILRLIFLFRHYGDVAGKINHSKKHGAKWLASIDKDESLAQFTSLTACPNCRFDFDVWMEKARERQERGLDAPPVDSKFQRPAPR